MICSVADPAASLFLEVRKDSMRQSDVPRLEVPKGGKMRMP